MREVPWAAVLIIRSILALVLVNGVFVAAEFATVHALSSYIFKNTRC
jgi:hypothetical protein